MRKKEDFFDVITLSDAAIEELAKFLTVGIDDTTTYDETSKYLIDITNRFKRSGNETTIHISLSEPDRPSGRERLEMVIHEREHTQRYGALHDIKVRETEITFYRDTNRLYTIVVGHWSGRVDPLELTGKWEAGYNKVYQVFTQEQMDARAKEFAIKAMKEPMENRDDAYGRFKKVMEKHLFGLNNAPMPKETIVSLKEKLGAAVANRERGLGLTVPTEMDTMWNAADVTFRDDKKDAVAYGPIPEPDSSDYLPAIDVDLTRAIESSMMEDIKQHHIDVMSAFRLPPELLGQTVDVEVQENAVDRMELSGAIRENMTPSLNRVRMESHVSFDSKSLTEEELKEFAAKLGADYENMSEPFVPTWISEQLTPTMNPQMITRHMSQAMPLATPGRVMVQEDVSDEVLKLMEKYPSEEKQSPKICVIGGHGVPLGKIATDAIIASGGLAIPISTYEELHRHHGVESSTLRGGSVAGMSAEEYMEWDDRWRQGPRTFSACHLIPHMSIGEMRDRGEGNLNELYDPSVTPEELEEAEETINKPVAEVGILNFAKGLGTKLKTEVNREPRVFGGKTKKKKRWRK